METRDYQAHQDQKDLQVIKEWMDQPEIVDHLEDQDHKDQEAV